MVHSCPRRVGKLLCVCGREVHLVLVSLQKTCISGAVVPPEVTEGREEGGGESILLLSSPLLSSPLLFSLPLLPPSLPSSLLQRSLLCSVQSLSYRRPSTVPFLTVRMCNSYFTPGSPATATVAVRGGSAATGLVQMFIPSTPLPLFPSPHLPISPSLPLPLKRA